MHKPRVAILCANQYMVVNVVMHMQTTLHSALIAAYIYMHCHVSVSFVRTVLWLQDIIVALCTAAALTGGVLMRTTEAA